MPPLPEPHWTAYVTALLTPAVALLAASFAFLFSYRQWKLAQNKLKLDLFDRRWRIFDGASEFIRANASQPLISEDDTQKFQAAVAGARWLLNDDLADYFNELLKKSDEVLDVQGELSVLGIAEDTKKKLQKTKRALRQWFRSQRVVLEGKFAPFMSIQH